MSRDHDHLDLWQAYWRDTDSKAAIAALLDVYTILAHREIERISIRLPRHVDTDDLLQCAIIGLFQAIERFKLDSGALFRTFARRRIKGAILDELRRVDHVSRFVRAKVRHLQEASEELANVIGHAPDTSELAKFTKTPQDTVTSLLDSAQPWLSLDAQIHGSEDDTMRVLDTLVDPHAHSPSGSAEMDDTRNELRDSFRALSDREQKILYLYYYEELRLREIAELFNVTEARICQIHSAALRKLRTEIRLRRNIEDRIAV
jgi:RNA polymerase sigma factor for flagellar operon FliA